MVAQQDIPVLSYRKDVASATGSRKGNGGKLAASFEECDYVLREWITTMGGIGSYRISRLLGMNDDKAVRRWLSGEATTGPSQAYCIRMMWLAAQVANGLDLRKVKTILYSKVPFRVIYVEGAEAHKNEGTDAVPESWRDMPSPEGDDWDDIP